MLPSIDWAGVSVKVRFLVFVAVLVLTNASSIIWMFLFSSVRMSFEQEFPCG
jgi:hypothetical protein